MIVSNGAGFNYLVDVLGNLDLNVIEFLHRFQYGLYVIIFTRYCLLKFVLLDSFYHEKVYCESTHPTPGSLCGRGQPRVVLQGFI